MKRLFTGFILCAMFQLIVCCSEHDGSDIEYVSPVISALEVDGFVIQRDWSRDDHAFRLFWSRAREISDGFFNAEAKFVYNVEASLANDKSVAPVQLAENSDSSYLDVYISTLASLLESFRGTEEYGSVVIALTVKAVGEKTTLLSDPVMITITISDGQVLPEPPAVPDDSVGPEIPDEPQIPEEPSIPEVPDDPPFVFDALQDIFIIGDFNGWSVEDLNLMLPMFKNSNSETDYNYVFTGYLASGMIAVCTRNGDRIELEGFTEEGYECLTSGHKSIALNVQTGAFEITDFDASGYVVWDQMGFIGTFTGWSREHFMTRFSQENSHIWHLDVDVARSSENYHCGKFRANGSFDNLWNNYIGKEWETPFGSMTRSIEHDVNIYFDMSPASYRVVFNDITGHYILRRK